MASSIVPVGEGKSEAMAKSVNQATFSFMLTEAPKVFNTELVAEQGNVAVYRVESSAIVDGFVFDDPLAPYDATRGRVIHFKGAIGERSKPVGNALFPVAAAGWVRDKYVARVSQDIDCMNWTEAVSLPRTLIVGGGLSVWLWHTAISNGLLSSGNIFTLVVATAMLVGLTSLLSLFITWLETIVYEQLSERHYRPKMITVGNNNPDDEYCFIGATSRISSILLSFDDGVRELVRRKLRLEETDPDEVEAWCYSVTQLIQLREKLAKGFPTHLIPLKNADVKTLITDMKGKIAAAEEAALEKKRAEAEAREHGRSVSGIDEAGNNESKAILAGANAYLNDLGEDDFVTKE